MACLGESSSYRCQPSSLIFSIMHCDFGLTQDFTEKKAMKLLSALERKTVELVRISGDIVALARKFDEAWLQKSR